MEKEELINKVADLLDASWGNEDWKKLSREDKLRLIREQLEQDK